MIRAWLIFILCALHLFISQLYRTTNAVLAPWLVADMNLDTRGLGLLSAGFFYAFALTQIPISIFLDKVGAKRIMIVLSFVGMAGALMFSTAQGLGGGLTGRLLLGVGMACNMMGPLKLLTDWFSPRVFATLSGLLYAIGTLGNMVAATPLVLLVEKLGWRLSFQAIISFHLLITLALFWVVRDRPEGCAPVAPPPAAGRRAGSRCGNLGTLMASRDYWIISAGTFVRYGTHAALQTLWAGPLLMEALGFSPVQTGNILLAMNVGLILGGPLWGAVSDRFQTPKWVIAGGLLLMAAITFVLRGLPPGTSELAAGAVFFCFGLASASGMHVYAHIKALVPKEMAGAAMSGTNFFTMMGPAVFLQGLGIAMQGLYPEASRGPQAFGTALWICLFCQAAIGGGYLFTRSSYRSGNPTPPGSQPVG
ncbi:MAG: MFS transporter [Desulfobacterales bacterium]|jgi:MFS family permease|nr:MFS transporter [Desulfobacterales bacterium]